MAFADRLGRWLTVREGVVDPVRRTRLLCAVAMIVLAPLGLATKWVPSVFARAYAGDVLIVLFLALGVRLLLARASAARIALGVGAWAALVEFSQTIHPPWLEVVRATSWGRVLVGTTFEWADLAMYAAGLAAFVAIDRRWRLRAPAKCAKSAG